MKILAFQARSFSWAPHSKGLPEAPEPEGPGAVEDAVVAFLHVEASDAADRARAFRHSLKHLKWLANKRGLRNIVLHFFAHLGGVNAEPAFAEAFIAELGERLSKTGYEVRVTPFGYFCSWSLDVYGDSMGKVFKSI